MAKVWAGRLGTVIALAFLVLTFINASWIAPTPAGAVHLIADHAVAQQAAPGTGEAGTCGAAHIESPVHRFVENTPESVQRADRLGAQLIGVDVAATSDGRVALFRDRSLECRTNGTGKVRDHTLAELKALDAGYGYSADGGKTFPLRGKGVGGVAALEDVLPYAYSKPMLFNLSGGDTEDANVLVAALKAANRDVEKIGDGFYGSPGQLSRVRSAFPRAWTLDMTAAEACTRGYMLMGWFGMVPEACRNETMLVPLDQQWKIAGWPNRTQARMQEAGARILVVAPQGGKGPMGIDLPEQIGKIPMTFTGYVWVSDIWTIGPSLHSGRNDRTEEQDDILDRALGARRAARQ